MNLGAIIITGKLRQLLGLVQDNALGQGATAVLIAGRAVQSRPTNFFLHDGKRLSSG